MYFQLFEASLYGNACLFMSQNNKPKNKINEYVSIIKPLELKENKDGKFFMVGQEPDKGHQSQHLIWNHLQDSPLIKKQILEIVSPSELGIIESYLEEHDVRPFVEIEGKTN